MGLVAFPLLLGVADWYAVYSRNRKLEYVLKPATLIAVILWAIALAAARPAGWSWLAPFFVAGLVFSLAGDVFLMLPDSRRFFVPGLVSFLLGHVCYIAGLNATLPPAPALLLLVPAAAVWAVLIRGVAAGLRAHGEAKLLAPVGVYGAVLCLMLFSAWATLFRADWSLTAQVLAVAGGTLFTASDGMLAWDRFVRPWPHAHVYVMVTYHLAQICLAAVIAFAPAP